MKFNINLKYIKFKYESSTSSLKVPLVRALSLIVCFLSCHKAFIHLLLLLLLLFYYYKNDVTNYQYDEKYY